MFCTRVSTVPLFLAKTVMDTNTLLETATQEQLCNLWLWVVERLPDSKRLMTVLSFTAINGLHLDENPRLSVSPN